MWAEIEPLLMIRPPAGLLVLHEAERRLSAEKGAGQVHIDNPPPLLERQVFQRDAGTPCRRC